MAVFGDAFLHVGGAGHRPSKSVVEPMRAAMTCGASPSRPKSASSQPGRHHLFSFGQALGTDVMEPHHAAGGCEDKRPACTDVARADDRDEIRFHVAGCLQMAICV